MNAHREFRLDKVPKHSVLKTVKKYYDLPVKMEGMPGGLLFSIQGHVVATYGFETRILWYRVFAGNKPIHQSEAV